MLASLTKRNAASGNEIVASDVSACRLLKVHGNLLPRACSFKISKDQTLLLIKGVDEGIAVTVKIAEDN